MEHDATVGVVGAVVVGLGGVVREPWGGGVGASLRLQELGVEEKGEGNRVLILFQEKGGNAIILLFSQDLKIQTAFL